MQVQYNPQDKLATPNQEAELPTAILHCLEPYLSWVPDNNLEEEVYTLRAKVEDMEWFITQIVATLAEKGTLSVAEISQALRKGDIWEKDQKS